MLIQEPAKTNFDLNFSLFRVPVRIHPGFWIVSVLLNATHNIVPLTFSISIAILFISILVHEFGHALSSRYFGERRNYVILYSMGGLCVHQDLVARKGQRIWTILWGPFAGFLLGLIVLAICFAMWHRLIPESPLLKFVLYNALIINFLWGVINLFPVLPLDGGQIMQEIVRWKYPRLGDAFVCTVSIWTGGALFLLGIGAYFFFNIHPFTAFLFGVLAVQNYIWRKQILEMGSDYNNQIDGGPRQPWEQDADWWKNN